MCEAAKCGEKQEAGPRTAPRRDGAINYMAGFACRGKKGAEGMILSLLRSTDCGETRVVELVSRYLSRGVGSGLPADRWLLAGR